MSFMVEWSPERKCSTISESLCTALFANYFLITALAEKVSRICELCKAQEFHKVLCADKQILIDIDASAFQKLKSILSPFYKQWFGKGREFLYHVGRTTF